MRTRAEIRKIEAFHMRAKIEFRYQGRFMVCLHCSMRFRMRYNGTLHFIEPKA